MIGTPHKVPRADHLWREGPCKIKLAHYLAEHILVSKEEIIEHAGHVVNEENPQRLAWILDEFFDYKFVG